ncbi:MAG TPA: M12 family metallopeptidase [Bryobacteraceae bacterium]|nr:M12 family metallopeptidase [Bryobacteraceae bacterium]
MSLAIAATIWAQDAPILRGPSAGTQLSAPAVVVSATPTTEDTDVFVIEPIDPDQLTLEDSYDEVQYATLRVKGPLAGGTRLYFENFHLGDGQRLFVYGLNNQGAPINIQGPFIESGPNSDNEFWTETVAGSELFIEIQFGDEVPADLPFELTRLERVSGATNPAWRSDSEAPAREKKVSHFRGMVIEHEVDNGEGIFEGDILLGPVEELDPAFEQPANGKGNRRSAVGITATKYRWPGGVIPYVIQSGTNATRIQEAIKHWNTELSGVIRLVPRTSQTDYVRFSPSTACSSYIGRIGGAQDIRLASACSIGNIIHEIGHTIGLYHEQGREDRNNWVSILTSNLSAGQTYNFNQFIYSGSDLGYYSYNSIMHYNAFAYSNNGKPTIETKPAGIPIGQRIALDVSDVVAVRQMYGAVSRGVWIASVPAGLEVTVDGVKVRTPAYFNWSAGTVHKVSAPPTIAKTSTDTYSLVRWTDAGAASHSVTVPTGGLALTAVYKRSYTITATPNSTTSGTVAISPSTDTHADSAPVTLTAKPAPAFCFGSWSGINSAAPPVTTLYVKKAYKVTANFIPGSVSLITKSATFNASGGSGSISVASTSGCTYSISSKVPWIKLSKATGKSKYPNTGYTVSANTTGEARAGQIEVNGVPVTITQKP